MSEPARETLRCSVWAVTIAVVILGLSGCAYQPSGALSPSGPGFLIGLCHGFIAPISLLGSFVSDHRIYAFPNAGVIYDLGFLLGLSTWAGGGAFSARS
jgi:hypothetical protein